MSFVALIRNFQPVMIGSSTQGEIYNDIDILISVEKSMIEFMEESLIAIGFKRNIPNAKTLDPMIHSSFSMGLWDIQIATPENYKRKIAVNRIVAKHSLSAGKNKVQKYALYNDLYKLMGAL